MTMATTGLPASPVVGTPRVPTGDYDLRVYSQQVGTRPPPH